MRKLLTLLFLLTALNVSATNWLSYYVYSETKYMQGPWSRTDVLGKSGYRYLAPHYYEDLFGTVKSDLVNKMIQRLQEMKPGVYNWDYDLSIEGDTVIFSTGTQIRRFETVKNEITVTLTMNDFDVIIFRLPDKEETLTIDDVTLPFFDLVEAGEKDSGEEKSGSMEEELQHEKNREEMIITDEDKNGDKGKNHNLLFFALIFSVILNIVLIVFFIKKRS
ncbi:MAG: hypothetical protein R6U04_13975 [Bacteroidales bacterium]